MRTADRLGHAIQDHATTSTVWPVVTDYWARAIMIDENIAE